MTFPSLPALQHSSRLRRYIATRFTFPSTPITPAWPTLPFDVLQSAFSAVLDGNSVAFALSHSDLLMWVGAKWLSVSSFGVQLPITGPLLKLLQNS